MTEEMVMTMMAAPMSVNILVILILIARMKRSVTERKVATRIPTDVYQESLCLMEMCVGPLPE
jgi:hypothetical protein